MVYIKYRFWTTRPITTAKNINSNTRMKSLVLIVLCGPLCFSDLESLLEEKLIKSEKSKLSLISVALLI